MEALIQKWGNSLALRIPQSLATQSGIEPNSPVELSLRGAELVIAPVSTPSLKLDDLLAQVTADNLHGEVNTGQAVGGEEHVMNSQFTILKGSR